MLNASDVAIQAGIVLKRKGARLWACCPLHGEKTPSMCFYPDGRYHCFGCGSDGDGADLYAALHGVPLAEALRIVKGERYEKRPKKPTAEMLRQELTEWRAARWAEACRELHEAQAVIDSLQARESSDNILTIPDFWAAVDRKATANDLLNLLDSATMAQLLKWRAASL